MVRHAAPLLRRTRRRSPSVNPPHTPSSAGWPSAHLWQGASTGHPAQTDLARSTISATFTSGSGNHQFTGIPRHAACRTQVPTRLPITPMPNLEPPWSAGIGTNWWRRGRDLDLWQALAAAVDLPAMLRGGRLAGLSGQRSFLTLVLALHSAPRANLASCSQGGHARWSQTMAADWILGERYKAFSLPASGVSTKYPTSPH
jgi:hypothetical protein